MQDVRVFVCEDSVVPIFIPRERGCTFGCRHEDNDGVSRKICSVSIRRVRIVKQDNLRRTWSTQSVLPSSLRRLPQQGSHLFCELLFTTVKVNVKVFGFQDSPREVWVVSGGFYCATEQRDKTGCEKKKHVIW